MPPMVRGVRRPGVQDVVARAGRGPAAIGALLPGPESWRTLLKRSGGKTLGLSPSWPPWALSPSPPTACSPGPGDEHASRLTPTPSTWMRGRDAKAERSVYEVGATRRWLKVKQKAWTVEEDRSAGGSRGPPPRYSVVILPLRTAGGERCCYFRTIPRPMRFAACACATPTHDPEIPHFSRRLGTICALQSKPREAAIAVVADRLHGPVLFIALGEDTLSERIGQAEVRFVPYQRDPIAVAHDNQAADVRLYIRSARGDVGSHDY